MNYAETYKDSIENPVEFWSRAATNIDWFIKPETILKDSKWFVDGKMNTCYNAVDRHVINGDANKTALIYDCPTLGIREELSYQSLLDNVACFASILVNKGVSVGDTVLLYMPMIKEQVIAMLACARIGAIHSCVFVGFPTKEIAARIKHIRPKVIITTSSYLVGETLQPLACDIEQALKISHHNPVSTLVFDRGETTKGYQGPFEIVGNYLDNTPTACEPLNATDPLYILHTSGTTGEPKGIVHDNGGHAVALHWSMKYVYNIEKDDVYWVASDLGWIAGHSYMVYGTLLYGCTSVVFEGMANNLNVWEAIERNKVNCYFSSPTKARNIKLIDPNGTSFSNYDTSSLKSIFLAGERADIGLLSWLKANLTCPIVDHWWQTETAWPITANCLGIEQQKIPLGSGGKPVPGYNVHISKTNPDDKVGTIAIKKPLPPGFFTEFWGNPIAYDALFASVPGSYDTGDCGYLSEEKDLHIISRSDDVINVGGSRVHSGFIEENINSHPFVIENAVVGVPEKEKGEVPVAFVVLSRQYKGKNIKKEIFDLIEINVGKLAGLQKVYIVSELPKTRSGKILRRLLFSLLTGQELKTSSLENKSAIESIQSCLLAA